MIRVFKYLLIVALGLGLTTAARADLVRVSQESSAGAGDFSSNVLGYISVFSGGTSSLANYYSYDIPNNVSYGTNAPTLTINRSHLFLVLGTDGLGLFVVYDKPGVANGGGTANVDYSLVGDTAGFIVEDDPNDTYTNTGGTSFHTVHNWVSPNTDGTVIGTLNGNWSMYVDFNSWTGLTTWAALSGDGSEIGLNLQANRRVLLDLTPVPVPAGIQLSGLAVVLLGGYSLSRYRAKQKLNVA